MTGLFGRRAGGAAFVALLLLAGCGQHEADSPGASPAEARVAPDFDLPSLQGGSVALADLRGKTVIIDFWATWCPPCEFQVPELNTFYDAHRDDAGVAVLGISVDTEGADVVGAWVAEKEVRYPILLGGEDLARLYGAMGFPTLAIVAPDGSIDSMHVGLIERDSLEDALSRLRVQGEAP